MFSFINSLIAKVKSMIVQGADGRMHDKEFLEREIANWKNSPNRAMQIKGYLYYENEHDILNRKRTVIGEGGQLQEVKNLPNNRIIDNQYAKLVNQKSDYLLGKPFTVDTPNKTYADKLKKVFNKKFMKTLKNAGKAALNGGIVWLYPHYNEQGEFSFRIFPGYEILPYWKDSEHTILDYAVRVYLVLGYKGTKQVVIEKVEVYDLDGVHRFELEGNTLIPDLSNESEKDCPHVVMTDAGGGVKGFNWEKVPLIPLKYNENETPLLKKVKSLQDGINNMLSDFENNMQEDGQSTIYVLKNYDGTDLGEFRRNLSSYRAVKVRCDGDEKGGVDTLEIEVNADNYKVIVEMFKKAIIENGMGYDAKDDRLSGNPNQMNIKSMYSDIDLDANDMETELQSAFEEILWFVNNHLANTGQGNFEGEDIKIVFNRDILINEGEIIANCSASAGIISDKTIISHHPWIEDLQIEMERLQKEKQEAETDPYNSAAWKAQNNMRGTGDIADEEWRVLEKEV